MSHLKLFIIAFLVFVITDNTWLGIVAKNMYFEAHASWLRLEGGQLQPVWWAVAMVFMIFTFFAVFYLK